MLEYRFVCKKCNWKGSRYCEEAQRDNQLCEELVVPYSLCHTLLEQYTPDQARVEELEAFARDIERNWDCDYTWGKHDPHCRCCAAHRLLHR